MKTNNFKQIRFFALIAMSLFTMTFASATTKTASQKVQSNESEAINIDESIIETIKNDYKMLVKLPEVVIDNNNQESQEVEVVDNPVYAWSAALETLLNQMQNEVSKSDLYSYHK